MKNKDFEKTLGALKGMKISLILSDNQFVEGILLNVQQDHVICEVNKVVYYIAMQHIHAISKSTKDYDISSNTVPYLESNYFINILKAMKYNWVKVNSLSNRALIGVLSRISPKYIVLINGTEIIYVQKSTISNIYSRISKEQINSLNTQIQMYIEHLPMPKDYKDTNEVNMTNEGTDQEVVLNTYIPIEVNDEKEVNKNTVVPFTEQIYEKGKGAESVSNRDLETNEKAIISGTNDSFQPDNPDLQSKNEEYLLVVIPTGIEANKGFHSKEQIISTHSKENSPPKKFISTILNSTHHRNEITKKFAKVNEFLVLDRNTKEWPSPSSQKKKGNIKLAKKKLLAFIKERPDPIKISEPSIPVRKLSSKEEKEMLEKQYYALMNHATRMYDHLQITSKSKIRKVSPNSSSTNTTSKLTNNSDINIVPAYLKEETLVEKQYYALMKYTTNKYLQLREERLAKKS